MRYLLWKWFGWVSVVVFNKFNYPSASFVKYSKTAPLAYESYNAGVLLVELNTDGTTSNGGRWKPLYPVDYKHPEK